MEVIEILRTLSKRIAYKFQLGTVSRSSNDDSQFTTENGHVLENVKRLSHYGFHSVPEDGDTGTIHFFDDSFALVSNTKSDKAPSIAVGEAVLFNHLGHQIYLKSDGVVIDSTKADINCPVTINGNATVNGDLTVSGAVNAASVTSSGDVVGGGKSLVTHTHPAGSPPGQTGTPT